MHGKLSINSGPRAGATIHARIPFDSSSGLLPERREITCLGAFGDSCISSSNESMIRKSPTDKLLAPKNGVHTRQ